MAEQTEKAFLKQPKVFLSSKKSGKGKRPGKGGNRFWKNIGLGFKTPREAIEGTYIDKKCPFSGTVSIRGRILAGTCHSAKMVRTIIVRRNYLHWVKKYQRYEKRHSNIPAHVSPCFRVKEGDHVIIGQCRPLSKTVRFNVLKVIPAGSSAGGKKAFTGIHNGFRVICHAPVSCALLLPCNLLSSELPMEKLQWLVSCVQLLTDLQSLTPSLTTDRRKVVFASVGCLHWLGAMGVLVEGFEHYRLKGNLVALTNSSPLPCDIDDRLSVTSVTGGFPVVSKK
ncbi:unnamed protein product [Dovyalis caffra]|uniref:Small ribosomal subunit protein uS17 n=1 Tax=Dovyalis caffra TaxID=77055 RepID=A0AAV1RP95_9ROSI|nr:unnamed protein product [Dovyalis caffra]